MQNSSKSMETIAAQRMYVEKKLHGSRTGLFVPEAFVRGIRHIGYKSNVEAISELIDNSIQAYSDNIDLVFSFSNGGSTAKPTQLSVIDDGHGMSPSMLSFALMWGGTHRENDRSGLGRFGYGLPCATVSIGRRFTIYSKVPAGEIHSVTLDLDLLDAGAYRSQGSEIAIPPARPATLPKFLREFLVKNYPAGWNSGTIVVIDKLDRLDWTTATGLRRNLIRHFGVTYHKLLGTASIRIAGERVQPIDPLFLSPGCELYSLDEDRAQSLEPITFEIASYGHSDAPSMIALRYAWLPPSFGATDKARDAVGINANERFPIIKHYHGIIFSRNGRVIDVQSRTPWTTFINNDRYIRIEIEFTANLDEGFGVTTSKQQVSVSPEMWNRLAAAGLPKAIEHLRSKVRMAKAERGQRSAPSPALAPPSRVEEATRSVDAVTHRQPSSPAPKGDTIPPRHSAGKQTAPAKLDLLLSIIQRRMALAAPAIVEEYEQLLREWAHAPCTNDLADQNIHDFQPRE